MEILNAIIYDKSEYDLKEACDEFVSLYVLPGLSDVAALFLNTVSLIKENKYLMLEESESKIIILTEYDFEDFDFIKGN